MNERQRNEKRRAILYGSLLCAFTLYVLLDTFVIVRRYQPAEAAEQAAYEAETDEAESDRAGTADTTSHSYADADVRIDLSEYEVDDTAVYVADIRFSGTGRLKTALAQNTYGKNVTEKTSAIAAQVGAVLAVNGDFYGARERGYVIRNGVLYRDASNGDQEDLVIYADGTTEIIVESEISAQELLARGAVQVFSFGPAIVENTEIAVTESDEVGKAMASNPRTAIGVIDDRHYVLVVSDGRTEESEGLSLYGLAAFMRELGVQTAYNLDGGGSSTMYFNGEIVNNPTTHGGRIKERSVSDIVYI